MRRLTLLLVVAFLAGACSSEEPLQGIDLPPASVPEEIGETWAVLFTHEFPPGTWDQGSHAYGLALACDAILDEPLVADQVEFLSAPSEVFDQEIYLRIVGLSHDLTGPPTLGTIDPQQLTTAALTIIGVSETAANEAVETCAGAIFYDDAAPVPLFPQPPFRP